MNDEKKYAIIRSGAHQHRVEVGATVAVEKIAGEAGDSVTFDDVLLVANGSSITVGTPVLEANSVTATIIGTVKEKKVVSYKKKRRKGFHWKKGHRQAKTNVRIESIN